MAIFSHSRSGTVTVPSPRLAWIAAGASLAAATVAMIWLFFAEAQGAYRVWIGSTAYNHCFLVVPVAAYLAWTRRGSLAGIEPSPSLGALLLLVPLGIVWLVAALMSVLELQQLIVMAMFQAIALAVLGWRAYRVMLVPFLYLFFLVPTGYFLVPYLQDWTATFAVAGLRLVGIPVYSDGMFIEVPSGNFVIAEACAGLRFLIASVAFGVFFASLVYRSRVRWVGFVALSVAVPIVANWFRAFGIIALSEVTGNAAAVEADHIIYGWGFFTAITLLLIVIGLRFADDTRPADETVRATAAPPPRAPARPWRAVLAAGLGLALAAGGPAYAQIRDWRGSRMTVTDTFAEPAMDVWKPLAQNSFGWKPVVADPDREYLRTYGNGRANVQLYEALYKDAGFHNNLVRGTNDIVDSKLWHLASNGFAAAQIGGTAHNVAVSEIAGLGGKRLLVWSFYVVDGQVAATPMRAKLLQLRHIVAADRGTDAFVAVAVEEGLEGASADDALGAFLSGLRPPGT